MLNSTISFGKQNKKLTFNGINHFDRFYVIIKQELKIML
jgi:hypothetical protein